MKENKFDRIAEGAYFSIDLASYQSTIIPYDAVVANSTILMGGEDYEDSEDLLVLQSDPDVVG